MNEGTVLHLFGWDKKFVLPFRDFIHEHFPDGRHQFIIFGDVTSSDVPISPDTSVMPNILKNAISITKAMNKADKIVIHGLFNNHLFYLLTIQSWLLKKCYWFIWGGDLYIHNAEIKDWRWKKNEILRQFILKRIGHIVTYIKGDFELAKKWYGVTGEYHHCVMYPSNLYEDIKISPKKDAVTNILVGNSADPTNNHKEALEKIAHHKNEKIKIFCPLSYGPVDSAKYTVDLGDKLFEDKFIPLLDFIELERYQKILGEIDIAVFTHKRQQAMGNIISLLGLGKKVYMRSDITPWVMFEKLGIKVFDVMDFDLAPINDETRQNNQKKIISNFSKVALARQLRNVFEG